MFIAEILDQHLLPAEKVFHQLKKFYPNSSALQFGEAEAPEIEKDRKRIY
jgi:hypothetical protein